MIQYDESEALGPERDEPKGSQYDESEALTIKLLDIK
jgi:hypothetical protein